MSMLAYRWSRYARLLVTAASLGSLQAGTARAQQRGWVDTLALQRLLVAEDARGTGTDGVGPLLDDLRSPDTLLRRVAVRSIGRLQRPDLGRHLLDVLADSMPSVRAEVGNAIAQSVSTLRRGAPAGDSTRLDVPAAASALIDALAREPDDGVAGALAEALGRLHFADSTDARLAERAILRRLRRRPSFDAARGLYWLALARRSTGPLGPEAVVFLRSSALSASTAVTRRVSVLALNLNATLDSASIFAASADPDEQVRRLALGGAGGLPPSDRAALVRRTLADPSPIVRIAAVGAAHAGNQPDCGPIIAATGDGNDYVALTAIDALGAPCADSAAAASALAVIVTRQTRERVPDHAWQRSAHALVSLARIDSARAMDLVTRFVASTRWEDRVYAATAAANAQNVPQLLRLAGDPDDNVREAAILGLARTAKHDADSAYVAALRSQGYQAVLAAAEALNGSRHPAALPALLDAFDTLSAKRSENARDPRLAVLKRVTEMGTEANAARLEPYLADFDTLVAGAVAGMLTKWSGTTVSPHPVPLAIQPEPLARIFLARDIRLRVTMAASSGGGTYIVRLRPDEAPATVARVIRLARTHYYDGHVLQRVEPNFVIQGGGPGASEYIGDISFMRDELSRLSHRRGTFGISSRGRDTGDAQWFVNLVDNTRLDHEYTVFGEVVSGINVVDRILEGDTIAHVEVIGAP